MKKRAKRILTGLLVLCIIVFGLYLFNSEKLFPEYWLQRNFEKYRIEKLDNVVLTDQSLSYQLVYNDQIDLYLSIYSNGIVSLITNKWNSKIQEKTTLFNSDSIVINQLIDEFKKVYVKSEMKDIENHLSKYYSVMTLNAGKSNAKIKIEFYNIKPDKKFKVLKNKIVSLITNEFNETIN